MPTASSHAALPDEALMVLYADGDAEAFDELFRRHESRAYAYFLKRTGSPDRARDLYQELFLRIHRGRHGYDPGRGFTPWFFQIAHRLLIDDQRRAHRCHEVPIDDREFPDAEPRGAQQVADREQVLSVLGELSSEERYILVSAKVEGIGYGDLARELGKSVAAVKKAASRAMQRLRAASGHRAAPAGVDAG